MPALPRRRLMLSSRTLAVLALVAAVVAVAALGPAATHAPAAALIGDCSPGSDWGTPRDDLAAQTVALVNSHRASLGLGALVVDPALQASAVWKSRHMARYGYMAHDDPAPPVARSSGDRMAACGYTDGWGENIAYGYSTAAAVVNAWLASPGHRANIERPGFVAIGAGAAAGPSGQVAWTHTFGTRTGAAAPGPPAPAPPPAPVPPPAPAPPPVPAPPPSQPVPPGPPAQPTPQPARPAPDPARTASDGLTLRGLTVAPRPPRGGGVLTSRVAVLKRGARVERAHVFCSARVDGRKLAVAARRMQAGTAICAWRVPVTAGGKLLSASVIVQHGRVQVRAPFRVRVP